LEDKKAEREQIEVQISERSTELQSLVKAEAEIPLRKALARAQWQDALNRKNSLDDEIKQLEAQYAPTA
jgi:hypothetical protein